MSKKQIITKQNFSVSYTCRDAHTGDDIKNINMSWENQPEHEIRQNLNVWLASIGLDMEVILKQNPTKK